MESPQNPSSKRLTKVSELAYKNPKTNPFSKSIFDHEDLIWLEDKEQAKGFDSFIAQDGPLLLDLGSGSGNFIRQYAHERPNWKFIGFEIRFKRLVRSSEKYKRDGLGNIRLVRGMAEDITKWFAQNSIDIIHVNFPDPWAKDRQKKHRLVSPALLQQIHYLLKPGGEFIFKTDHEEYFDSSQPILEESPLEIVDFTRDLHKTEFFNLKTEFEKLFESKGLPVYYVRTIKN